MIKQRQVDAFREVRMWLTQVIFPLAVIGYFYFSDPENRESFKRTFSRKKN